MSCRASHISYIIYSYVILFFSVGVPHVQNLDPLLFVIIYILRIA